MILIIAEKPELGKAIADALEGERKNLKDKIVTNEYTICWALGHILRNKEPHEINTEFKKWEMTSLPIFFENWEKTVIKGKEETLNNILELIKNSDEIIHAGDPDDEGQYLIDEILEFADCKKPVKRILINDNNPEAIKKAFTKLEDNSKYIPLGKAAEARSISDILLGINLSRFFTLYNNSPKPLTVGRVQTPTLALVVNRDEEIKKHIREKYYELYLKLAVSGTEVKLKHGKQTKENITDKYILEQIISKLKNKNEVLKISKKEEYSSTPLPFNLAKLQIEANKKFGYSVQQVLDITQTLREKHKAITYNRSDSEYLSEEHFKESPKLVPEILKKIGMDVKVDFSEKNKSRCFNEENITAHHAIIPTFNGKFEDFTESEKNIYLLIAKRFLIQFMDKEKVEKTEANLTIEGEIFKASSKKVLERGYTEIYIQENTEEDSEEENDKTVSLSELSEGEYNISVTEDNFYIDERETKPKKHYTEASLLHDMTSIAKYVKNKEIKEILKLKDKDKKGENGSIGTSATRATIIGDLFKRGYIERKGKTIVSTELAREYLKILPESLKTPDTTALWWTIQEEIKEGRAQKEDLILSVLEDVKDIITTEHTKISDKLKDKLLGSDKNKRVSIGKCPKCGGEIYAGEKNYYCGNYKTNNCNFSLWKNMKLYKGKDNEKSVEINENNARNLLNKGSILIENLKSKNGNKYSAYFVLNVTDKYVGLKFLEYKNKK